jgi:hypothetical protein
MHEETPVESIIALHGPEATCDEIVAVLQLNDPASAVHVLSFVRDASLNQHQFRDAFRECLKKSVIWDTFRRLLEHPSFSVRSSVIYTIGKLTDRERSHLLSEAFPFFLNQDPINLPRLLQELVWLTNKWPWDLLSRVVSADHYIQRWSLCKFLNSYAEDTLGEFQELLKVLKQDSNPLVAAEANFRFERIVVKLRPKLPKSEWRKEVKRIEALEPKVTFERAAMKFMPNREDYTLDEFHNFVEALN